MLRRPWRLRVSRSRLASAERLLAQIFEGDLNSIVEQLLHIDAELIATACAAMEELHHLANRRVWLAFDLGGAAEVSLPVKVEIHGVLKDLAGERVGNHFGPDAQHLGARAG